MHHESMCCVLLIFELIFFCTEFRLDALHTGPGPKSAKNYYAPPGGAGPQMSVQHWADRHFTEGLCNFSVHRWSNLGLHIRSRASQMCWIVF